VQDAGGAQHPGTAEGNQDRAFRVAGEAALEADRPQLVEGATVGTPEIGRHQRPSRLDRWIAFWISAMVRSISSSVRSEAVGAAPGSAPIAMVVVTAPSGSPSDESVGMSSRSAVASHLSASAVVLSAVMPLRCTACRTRRGTTSITEPSSNSRARSEEHTSELQSRENLVCRLLLE